MIWTLLAARPRSLTILAGLSLTLATTTLVSSQSADRLLVLTGRHLLEFTPAGPTTVVSLPPQGILAGGMCQSVDNDAVVLHLTSLSRQFVVTHYVVEYRAGVLTTFATSTGTTMQLATSRIAADQSGDYVLAASTGLLRADVAANRISTVAMLSGTSLPQAVAADPRSGDWLLGRNRIVDRSGVVTTLGPTPPTLLYDVHPDLDHGASAYIASHTTGLHRWDLAANTTQTLIAGPGISAIEVDVRDRTLLWTDKPLPFGTMRILRGDSRGNVLSTVASMPPSFSLFGLPHGLLLQRTRHVSGAGPATPGSTYSLSVSFPTLPSHNYALGASLSVRPGIPTPVGVIPLTPDPLFALSRAAPQTQSIFSGFSGQIRATGRASASIKIPAFVSRGTRIYIAGIAYDSTGVIRRISEPHGVTVE